jgi:hypothetical protein
MMHSENRTSPDTDDSLRSAESSHSFHDLLLNRSKEALPSRKRDRLAGLQNRKSWVGWLFWLLGDGMILLGGVAIGAGGVLLIPKERFPVMPGLAIIAGLGSVILVILTRLLVKSRSVPATEPIVRG